MLDSMRWLCFWIVPWTGPFHISGFGASRNQPVITGAISTIWLKLDLNAVFEIEPHVFSYQGCSILDFESTRGGHPFLMIPTPQERTINRSLYGRAVAERDFHRSAFYVFDSQ